MKELTREFNIESTVFHYERTQRMVLNPTQNAIIWIALFKTSNTAKQRQLMNE